MNNLNLLLSKANNTHYSYIPTPKFNSDDMIMDIPYEAADIKLIHICAVAAQSWEAVYTGANGLRYLSHEENYSVFKVVSKEFCGATDEDLSSITKWANKVPITPEIRRCYWFLSTFGNCATISLCVEIMIEELIKMNIQQISHEDGKLVLKTAKVCGFSVLKKDNFESFCLIDEIKPDSKTAHLTYESHNHIVLSI